MELEGNSLVDGHPEPIKYYDAWDNWKEDPTGLLNTCNAIFTVEGKVKLPWGIPFLSSGNIGLTSEHTSFIECEPSKSEPTP